MMCHGFWIYYVHHNLDLIRLKFTYNDMIMEEFQIDPRRQELLEARIYGSPPKPAQTSPIKSSSLVQHSLSKKAEIIDCAPSTSNNSCDVTKVVVTPQGPTSDPGNAETLSGGSNNHIGAQGSTGSASDPTTPEQPQPSTSFHSAVLAAPLLATSGDYRVSTNDGNDLLPPAAPLSHFPTPVGCSGGGNSVTLRLTNQHQRSTVVVNSGHASNAFNELQPRDGIIIAPPQTLSLRMPASVAAAGGHQNQQHLPAALHSLHPSSGCVVPAPPLISINDNSNMSSAGSSDREPETPEKIQKNTPGPDRKRRRREGGMSVSIDGKLSRSDGKKLTEFFPKAFNPVVNASTTVVNTTAGLQSSMNNNFNGGIVGVVGGSNNTAGVVSAQAFYGENKLNRSNCTTPIKELLIMGGVGVSKDVQTEWTGEKFEQFTTQSRIELGRKELQLEDNQRQLEDLRRQLSNQQGKLEAQTQKLTKCVEVNKKLLIDQTMMSRKEIRARCLENNLRLGQYRSERTSTGFQENWVDGHAFDEIQKKQRQLIKEREEIERNKKLLTKRKPSTASGQPGKKQSISATTLPTSPSPASTVSCVSIAGHNSNSNDGFAKPDIAKELTPQEYYEQDEILKLRLQQLKKEESELTTELERLERERNLHIRELKRISHEDASKYNQFPMMNRRYLLLSLLGKGGFSEVYMAYDIEEMRNVACKMHHVNPEWKEDKKANYVKHATREKDIHKTLDHPRIVKLYEVFTINKDSFCTVLEYCDGNDLDFYLKQHKLMSERDARCIVMQIVSALKYLNEIKPPVIHYDLKPANILITNRGSGIGEIKITDFGLSKLMTDDKYDADQGMELTSQFAGTYWYLPPECFVIGSQPTKISSKVDVWSVGVIFYQCLYGKRPFGHELSQQIILEHHVILKATEVNFPNKPTVNNEAKQFIRCCLQYKKEDRYDVFQLYNHDYLRPKTKALLMSTPSSPLPPAPREQMTASSSYGPPVLHCGNS